MIIKDAQLFVWAEEPQFVQGDILIEGTEIVAVGQVRPPLPDEEVLDASGLLALPGFINAHYHSYTNLLKGTTQGEPLELWSLGTVALGGALTQEEMALAAQLGICEMMHHGVTSCVDHIPHPQGVEPIAMAYARSGFRAAIAPMLHDLSDHFVLTGLADCFTPEQAKQLKQVIPCAMEQYPDWIDQFNRPKQALRVHVGPNSPQRLRFEGLRQAGMLAEKHGLFIHTHLLETTWQRDSAGMLDPVEALERAGLLNEKTTLAHCIWLEERQLERIGKSKATVVHNPSSNLFLGSGRAKLGRMRAEQIELAFGADGLNCGSNLNMLEVARTGLLLSRLHEMDSRHWMNATQLWRGLTLAGATPMGEPGRLGALASGMLADITLCRADSPALQPPLNLAWQIAFQLSQPQVQHLMIHGQMVLRDGKIRTVDEADLYQQLRALAPSLKKRQEALLASTHGLKESYQRAYNKRMERGRRMEAREQTKK